MTKKIKKSQLDSLLSTGKKRNIHEENFAMEAEPLIEAEDMASHEEERLGWKLEADTDELKNPKKRKMFSKIFKPQQKLPEVTPVQSGSVDILDIIAPASADLCHRDYIVVDGIYFAYLYLMFLSSENSPTRYN